MRRCASPESLAWKTPEFSSKGFPLLLQMHRCRDANPETPNPGFCLSVCHPPTCPRPPPPPLPRPAGQTWHDFAGGRLRLSRCGSETGRKPSPTSRASRWATGRRTRRRDPNISDLPEKRQKAKMMRSSPPPRSSIVK